MQKYRQRSHLVDAIQYDGSAVSRHKIVTWLRDSGHHAMIDVCPIEEDGYPGIYNYSNTLRVRAYVLGIERYVNVPAMHYVVKTDRGAVAVRSPSAFLEVFEPVMECA